MVALSFAGFVIEELFISSIAEFCSSNWLAVIFLAVLGIEFRLKQKEYLSLSQRNEALPMMSFIDVFSLLWESVE